VGTALSPGRGRCSVALDDGDVVDCAISNRIATRQRSALCPGDRVEVVREASGGALLVGVLPRRSALSRSGPERSGRHREQVIAANVDLVVVAVSVRDPAPRPGLIDRMLVAAERGGAAGAVCFNKWDLLSGAARRDSGAEVEATESLCRTYESLGVPVFRCCALRANDPGVAALRAAIAGHSVVLVGPSGVGKSSLLNALVPGADAATAAVTEATRKGRHTTTRAVLHRLADGTRIIDTPGIREFGLWKIDGESLRAHFSDVARFARGCRYRSCRHDQEPDCAVRAAVESGELAPSRHRSFLRLLAEVGA